MPQALVRLRAANVLIRVQKIRVKSEGFLGLRKHAEYEILTKYMSDRDGWTQSVSYFRYSELRAFHKVLRRNFPRFLCDNLSYEFLLSRAHKIENFLIQLVKSFGDVDVVLKFLGIDLDNLTPGRIPNEGLAS
ncbi:5305_t:CDS:2 [Ambispora gerdemannii]|uniref:5305_t:CDS:1 n=1 Tax=Ambispora gerdemannii TaxID=144530 RepID=A0A9N9GIT3_9GLOM|nr:5305_t:CDS:2 [Ambispora gerdemannii]